MSSIIKNTISDISIKKIPDRIALYEQLIDSAEPLFKLEGKTLEQCCKEHPRDLMFYDVTLQECKSIEDTIKEQLEIIEANLYKKFNENHSRALNSRDINQYIKGDQQYIDVYEILLEVIHIRRQLEAIVESLKSLGWALNNIVKIRIAQIEKMVL